MGARKVFLSRKDTDKDVISRIRDELAPFAATVEFVVADDIPNGEDWQQWLEDQIGSSDMLIVFTTGPSNDWDWLLYEAGMYRQPLVKDQTKPFCFHAGGLPLEPLKRFQCVACDDLGSVKSFLRNFFGEPMWGDESAINPKLAGDDDRLTQLAGTIVDAMNEAHRARAPQHSQRYNRYVDITFRPGGLANGGIPPDAIVDSNAKSLGIFGLEARTRPDGSPWTWGDLLENVSAMPYEADGAPQWVADLEQAVARAVKFQSVTPVRGLLTSQLDNQRYRPNVSHVDAFADDTRRVTVLFIHQPFRESLTDGDAAQMTEPVDVTTVSAA